MRCSILATFSEADTFQAAMRAVGLLSSRHHPERAVPGKVQSGHPRSATLDCRRREPAANRVRKGTIRPHPGRVHAREFIPSVVERNESACRTPYSIGFWRKRARKDRWSEPLVRYLSAQTGVYALRPCLDRRAAKLAGRGKLLAHAFGHSARAARYTCRGNTLSADRHRHARDIGGWPWSGTAVDPCAGRLPVRRDETDFPWKATGR